MRDFYPTKNWNGTAHSFRPEKNLIYDFLS